MLGAVLVALRGAPPEGAVVAALARETIAVVSRDEACLREPAAGVQVALIWIPAEVSDERLAAVVAWRDRAPAPALVLGCAPQGPASLSERALTLGFDDFVAGRASPRELAARLRVLARRGEGSQPRPDDVLAFGRLALDRARHDLLVGDRRISLTSLEVALLGALIEAQGRALTREELLDQVWGADNLEVGPRAVDNLVLRLRRKIGEPDSIHTVRGMGFRVSDEP